ncbi:mCG145081, partial [Mus musculus]
LSSPSHALVISELNKIMEDVTVKWRHRAFLLPSASPSSLSGSRLSLSLEVAPGSQTVLLSHCQRFALLSSLSSGNHKAI